MENQEQIFRLSMLEQEASRIEQQMQLIEQQIVELQTLKSALKEIESSEEKTMLANLGKGVFVKTEITDKELIVDVGSKTFIKKSIPETIKVIENELKKLIETKGSVIEKMQEFQMQMQDILSEIEAQGAKE